MATKFFNGYCPECALKDIESKMILSRKDVWECKNDNLQILSNNVTATILRFRGHNAFRSEINYATDFVDGNAILIEAEDFKIQPTNNLFNSDEELQNYLSEKVEPFLEFSLENLIKTYVERLFEPNEFTELSHRRQADYFQIYLKNERAITSKLEKRDINEGKDRYHSYKYLYSLLVSVFEKYYNSDSSWLPEMGMTMEQTNLCNKHLSRIDREDKKIVREKLMELMIDLIEIIYLDKEITTHNNAYKK